MTMSENEQVINVIDKFPEVARQMENLCRGLYQTAKYLRMQNTLE